MDWPARDVPANPSRATNNAAKIDRNVKVGLGSAELGR